MTEQDIKNIGFNRIVLNDLVFEGQKGYHPVVYSLNLPELERRIETTVIEPGKKIKFTVSDPAGNIIQRIEATPDEDLKKCITALVESDNLLRRIKKSAFDVISKMH